MEHSRQWELHIGGSKMFELLFRAGMRVFAHFFAEYQCHLFEWVLEAKNRVIDVKNIPKKLHFLNVFSTGPAQIGNSQNGQAQISNSRDGPAQNNNSRNGPALKSWMGLANFGNSRFGLSLFGNFLFGAGPLKQTFEKMLFFSYVFHSHVSVFGL